VQKLN